MKAYLLFTFIFMAIAGSTMAQEPTPIKEKLFGKDYKTQMQQEQGSRKRVAADPRKTATSTRSVIFNDYHQPAAKSATRKVNTAKQASGKPVPSGISTKEAAAKAPKPAAIKPPVLQQDASAAPEAKTTNKPTPVAKKN
jgi:hypothetical protein